MRIVIASDIHGSALYCRQLLDAFHREDAEKLLLLGDILYHGPRNDLPDGYAPKEVTAMLNADAASILGVRGNCDSEVDQMILSFPMMADSALLSVGKHLVFATFCCMVTPMCRAGSLLATGIFILTPAPSLCPRRIPPADTCC